MGYLSHTISRTKEFSVILMKDHASCVIDGHANLIWTRLKSWQSIKTACERHVYWCVWQATVSLAETTPRMHEPCRQIPAWISHWTVWELSYSEVNLSTSPPIITTEQNFKRFYQLLSCSYIPNSSFFAVKRNISCDEGQCKLEQFTVVIKKRLSTIHDKKNFRSNRFALYLK